MKRKHFYFFIEETLHQVGFVISTEEIQINTPPSKNLYIPTPPPKIFQRTKLSFEGMVGKSSVSLCSDRNIQAKHEVHEKKLQNEMWKKKKCCFLGRT